MLVIMERTQVATVEKAQSMIGQWFADGKLATTAFNGSMFVESKFKTNPITHTMWLQNYSNKYFKLTQVDKPSWRNGSASLS